MRLHPLELSLPRWQRTYVAARASVVGKGAWSPLPSGWPHEAVPACAPAHVVQARYSLRVGKARTTIATVTPSTQGGWDVFVFGYYRCTHAGLTAAKDRARQLAGDELYPSG